MVAFMVRASDKDQAIEKTRDFTEKKELFIHYAAELNPGTWVVCFTDEGGRQK